MTSGGGITAVALVTVATVGLGVFGLRFSRTTSDFLVASRTVRPWGNAAAISGEYLSAASFLGIAGLVMVFGVDMLWYPVGYTAGYLLLLLLVAAPLRRSGAYTLPDFTEARLAANPAAGRRLRLLASIFVVMIGWLYMLPQLQGAGLTLQTITGVPAWVGAVIVAAVVTGNVAGGGMRSITFVQAFQFWLKLTAISLPAVALLVAWHAHGAPALTAPLPPHFRHTTTVHLAATVRIVVGAAERVGVHGSLAGRHLNSVVTLARGSYRVGAGTRLVFPAGAAVPHLASLPLLTGRMWSTPLAGGQAHPLYATYSLVLATFLGTMGLPHVLVRFYTNPDGSQARRTTLLVLVLLGAFYLMPAVYGALGRLYSPQLLLTGNTDAVVLVLPGQAIRGLGGQLLDDLTAAGAFAAFLSTTSGLVVSVAGALVQDVLRRPVRRLRGAAVVAGLIPLAATLGVIRLPVSTVVGLAFAVAASSFCPLLLLGVWWRGLTDAGAAAGLVLGGGLAAADVLATLAGFAPTGWPAALVAQPAAWTVPIAFVTMIVVSRATRGRVPAGVGRILTAMHAPEGLGLLRGLGATSAARPPFGAVSRPLATPLGDSLPGLGDPLPPSAGGGAPAA